MEDGGRQWGEECQWNPLEVCGVSSGVGSEHGPGNNGDFFVNAKISTL